MPELPEVETVVWTLKHLIQNREIKQIEIVYPKIIEMDSDLFQKKLTHQHFRQFKRRGKYLLFEMDDIVLVSHLRMEGKFYYQKESDPPFKHTHLLFHLDNGMRLDYVDSRKFGRMELMEKQTDYLDFKQLGPEPWEERLNVDYVQKWLQKRSVGIKQVLLDQRFVAGIGNIYADEICFKMKLHPKTPACLLTKKQCKQLIEAIQTTLDKAIEAGGSTIRSYTSSLGVTGLFQLEIDVYGRAGQPCRVCGTTIEKMKIAQRGTSFCPTCQRKKEKR